MILKLCSQYRYHLWQQSIFWANTSLTRKKSGNPGVSNRVNRSLNSSVVLSGDKKISFVGEMNKAVLGYDHLVINNDDELLSVEISYSDKKVSLICNEKESYVQKIRKSFVL